MTNNRVDGSLALSRALGDYGYKNNGRLNAEQQKVCCCGRLSGVVICGVRRPGRTMLVALLSHPREDGGGLALRDCDVFHL